MAPDRRLRARALPPRLLEISRRRRRPVPLQLDVRIAGGQRAIRPRSLAGSRVSRIERRGRRTQACFDRIRARTERQCECKYYETRSVAWKHWTSVSSAYQRYRESSTFAQVNVLEAVGLVMTYGQASGDATLTPTSRAKHEFVYVRPSQPHTGSIAPPQPPRPSPAIPTQPPGPLHPA